MLLFRQKKSVGEAKDKVWGLVEQAKEDQEFLREQIERSGDAIMSRLNKKNHHQRQLLLLTGDKDICKNRWFTPRQFLSEPPLKEARKQRNKWLVPYLSLEVLMKDRSIFLNFLYNRIRQSIQQLKYGWEHGFFAVEFCEICVKMFDPNYGQLTAWESDSAHRSDILGYPRGSMLLEAQAYIMRFLRNIVGEIFKVAPTSNQQSSTKWKEMAQVGFKENGENAGYWFCYSHQPFLSPPTFNMEVLLGNIKARLDETGDHIWLLQTDANYLWNHLRELRECQVIEDATDSDKQLAFELVVGEVIYDLHVHWFWTRLHAKMQPTKELYARFRDNINIGEALPPMYDVGLGDIERLLLDTIHVRSLHLGAIIPQRPGLRNAWNITKVCEGVWSAQWKEPDMKRGFKKDPLDWCLQRLQEDPDVPNNLEYEMLFEFLDDHLQTTNRDDRARLDRLIYEKLSDLAALQECLVAIRLHRRRSVSDLEFPRENYKPLASLLKRFYEFSQPYKTKSHGSLTDFDDKNEAMQSSRNEVHNRIENVLLENGFVENEDDLKVLTEFASPGHLKEVQVERDALLATIENSKLAAKNSSKPRSGSSSPQAPYTQEIEGKTKVEILQKDTKIKTRPADPRIESAPILSAVSSPISPTPVPRYKRPATITKRALALIRAVFSSDHQESKKSIDWDTFVNSMSDLGFLAQHKGGSAVTFEHEGVGKIIFHRPHPASVLNHVMLVAMGKRLGKWFGWRREVFDT
ncbi:hypothetical protein HYALB_00008398 [Hymenoscyphus albidus]|uniref:YcfA-like protein n=1 Tax=Hymenoscyphus albidus TaxID=595503 RepID=A0A9N9LNM9_9HELO|nr:hypothetical protein HYALB_00008398 [Hymenoscyphus albidus]